MGIVENFLEDHYGGEIIIPSKIMEDDLVQELEDKLETGRPMPVKVYYDELPSKIDFGAISDVTEEIKDRENDHITKDDLKLIEFFSDEASESSLEDILKMTGVLVNILEIVGELKEHSDNIPENIKASAYLWVYLNAYELILGSMTQSLYKYFEDKDKEEASFIKGILDKGEHLNAGKLEHKLKNDVDILSEDNNSILSEKGSKLLRNKLGHANIFYDDSIGKFTVTNGDSYTYDEFMKEYEVLMEFLSEWVYQLNDKEAEIDSTLKEYFEKLSNQIGRAMLEIERNDQDFKELVIRYKDDKI